MPGRRVAAVAAPGSEGFAPALLVCIPEWFNNMPPLERSTIATCAEVALVVVLLGILLLKAAGELLACVLPVPPRAVPMICFLPDDMLTEVVLGAPRWPFALGDSHVGWRIARPLRIGDAGVE